MAEPGSYLADGVGLIGVVVALAVLLVVIATVFLIFPGWLGAGNVSVNIRP